MDHKWHYISKGMDESNLINGRYYNLLVKGFEDYPQVGRYYAHEKMFFVSGSVMNGISRLYGGKIKAFALIDIFKEETQ